MSREACMHGVPPPVTVEDSELVQDIEGRMILHWNYRNLREIPIEVLNHGEHIEEIYLKRNCLEKLPPNISKLCNLTNMYLVGNQLEELPNEIGDLKCLRVLDVSQNYMKKLPDTIGDLCLLQSLLVTYNQLEVLPKCLRKLRNLKQLEVSGNRIYSLPEEVVEGLESLEELGIDRNPISSIPRNVCVLTNLTYFSACRCNLLFLPSLPFHKLMHNTASTSSRTHSNNSNSGTFGGNKNLQFLFDGNPRLNYMPYWVFQLLGTNVECFGCGLEPGESDNAGSNPQHPHAHSSTHQASTQMQLFTYRRGVNRAQIKLNFKGKRRILHFDEDLAKLHHCGFNNEEMEGGGRMKDRVVSLLELCLRRVHSLGLLEEIALKKCGVNPVSEPLIVPQRAGDSLISIKRELDERNNIIPGNAALGENSLENVNSAVIGGHEESSMRDKAMESSPCANPHDGGGGGFKGNDDHDNNSSVTKPTSTTENETNESMDFQESSSSMLPNNLSRIVNSGPVARCFECLQPIFTETWPIVFHFPGWNFDEHARDDGVLRQGGNNNQNVIRGDWDDIHTDGKLSIGCTHFCTETCVKRFRSGTKFSSNLLMNDLRCILENEIHWSPMPQ